MTERGQGDQSVAQEQEREEYFRQLRQWLEETRQWNLMNAQRQNEFFNQMHNNVVGGSEGGGVRRRQRSEQQQQQQLSRRSQPPPERRQQQQDGQRRETTPPPPPPPEEPPQGTNGGRIYKQYRIPPLWRRFVAEVLDFMVLLTMKLILVVVSFELTGLFNIDRLMSNDDQVVAVELAVLELVQAVMSLVYESYFLSCEFSATPGKHWMGLQVLYVENIISRADFPPRTIACYPATQISTGRAFLRSISKHIMCAFLFPVFYSLMTIGFNRTRYDLYANTIVVEYNPNPPVYVN